jgi:hypothetical protein
MKGKLRFEEAEIRNEAVQEVSRYWDLVLRREIKDKIMV